MFFTANLNIFLNPQIPPSERSWMCGHFPTSWVQLEVQRMEGEGFKRIVDVGKRISIGTDFVGH